jgi:hypothetical protein
VKPTNVSQDRVEGWLNSIPAIDRDVTVKYFVQHFRIGYQSLAGSYQLFQRPLSLAFMRMSGADKVHRDVGINENHALLREKPVTSHQVFALVTGFSSLVFLSVVFYQPMVVHFGAVVAPLS